MDIRPSLRSIMKNIPVKLLKNIADVHERAVFIFTKTFKRNL